MFRKNLLYLFLFKAIFGYSQIPIPRDNLPNIREIYIDSKDTKLFCRILGEGKPLIIIHGGPGLTQDYLLPQMYQLANDYFVIFYDQRGCGKSIGKINENTINMDTFINDIEAIRQALHLNKISVLGHSWGGFLAMSYAITHPEHVDKLILANSMPASSEGFCSFVNEWMRRTAPYSEAMDEIKNTPEFKDGNSELIERYYRIIFRTYCYLPENVDKLNLKMSPQASINGGKVYEILRQNVFDKPFDLHAQLRNLTIPTLVIHGDFDPISPVTAQIIHENIKNSKYVLMKDCGHFPYVEKPEEFFNEIKQFLNERNDELPNQAKHTQ